MDPIPLSLEQHQEMLRGRCPNCREHAIYAGPFETLGQRWCYCTKCNREYFVTTQSATVMAAQLTPERLKTFYNPKSHD